MPETAPLAAIRFNPERTGGDLSALIAPPYDVLDAKDKDALLARDEHNIIALDLPHLPPKSAGPAEVYQRSARLLEQWLADGTLIRDPQPAFYVYHQRFEHAGKEYTQRMVIARVRLQPFSHGSILPHEQTFGGPKEDRLALMKATACQLSPILGLYGDTEDRIGSACSATVSQAPDVTGRLDGVENRMWIVSDRSVIGRVVDEMADKKVYIADGHHRYGTALLYRDWLAEHRGGSIPEDHPANYIMFVLAGMEDPGCLILPYHRALADIDVPTLLDVWSAGTEPAPAEQADMVVWCGSSSQTVPLRFRHRDILATLEPEQCAAWWKLDAAYLHRYLIDELLTGAFPQKPPQVLYEKNVDRVKQIARERSGVALLVNATPMAHLRAVSEAGGLMPQKSTCFHPKLATGFAINPLA